MSVIIRLQNLPWSANALDIRQYFHGLSIPEGGVHIVGGELGDAFIAFSTDEDARQAMLIDGGKIKEVKIKLFLSSRSEMQKVIETARAQTINLQSFMQMSAPPLSLNQGPVLPMLNQMPAKVVQVAPEIKNPVVQNTVQPVLQTHVLQQSTILPQTRFNQPSVPTANVETTDKKNNLKQNVETDSKEVDKKSKDNKKSRSTSRDRSRDRSRERSKSRDRRDFRSRDRYRDRKRRDRSRSRDRRRRNRDRSRSKEKSSRKDSRERRKDYDKTSNNEVDRRNSNKKSPPVEDKPESLTTIALPVTTPKPDLPQQIWVPINDNKLIMNPPPQPPIPPFLPQVTQPSKSISAKIGENPNMFIDQDRRAPMSLDMFPSFPPLQNEKQALTLQHRPDMFTPAPDNTPNVHLLGNWSGIPPGGNRMQMDKEPPVLHSPFNNMAMPVVVNRIDENLKPSGFTPQNPDANAANPFYYNKLDTRPQNDFGMMGQPNFGGNVFPPQRDFRFNSSLLERPGFRQDNIFPDKTSFRPDPIPMDRPPFRQETLGDKGNYRQDPINNRAFQNQDITNSKLNQRQDIERPMYRQNISSNERENFKHDIASERENYSSRPDRSMQSNDKFSHVDRSSPYSQRPTNQRGKYNNACVEVRNMSTSISYNDLRRFFQGLFIPGDGIKMISDCQGNRIGIAYIRFAKTYCKEQALKKNGNYIRNTMVEVLHINDDLFDKAEDSPSHNEGRNQLSGGHYTRFDEQKATDEFLALAIREFPPYTKEKDIRNIFSSWKLADCFLLPKSGRRNASAYVKFYSVADAQKALAATSRFLIGNKKIHVSVCYEHEFQDARDIKNMEDDEDDRLVIDTHDDSHSKITDAISPPKDPRIEAKSNNIRRTDIKKGLEINKNEPSQAIGSPNYELKKSKQNDHVLAESKKTSISAHNEIEPKPSEPFLQEVVNKNSIILEHNEPIASQNQERNIDHPDMKSNIQPGPVPLQRALLPTPNIMPLMGDQLPTDMGPGDFDQRVTQHNTDCVIMRGLPFQANDRNIIDFFAQEEVVPTQIHIMLDKTGCPAGDAFCEFSSFEEADYALNRNNTYMDRSLISVLPVSRQEMCEALGMPFPVDHQPPNTFTPRPPHPHLVGRGAIRGHFRQNFHPRPYHEHNLAPPYMGKDQRREMMPHRRDEREEDANQTTSVDAFGKPGCVLALENVPFKANVDEIIDFFYGFNVTRENVIRRYNEQGNPTGDARVALSSPLEAQKALKSLCYKQMRHRQIFMRLLS